ncbi:MAG: histidine kinase, partial [Deinococcus sp.]
GMGLYIVRSVVQGWGGQAWTERRSGGNAFCFTVPGVAGMI